MSIDDKWNDIFKKARTDSLETEELTSAMKELKRIAEKTKINSLYPTVKDFKSYTKTYTIEKNYNYDYNWIEDKWTFDYKDDFLKEYEERRRKEREEERLREQAVAQVTTRVTVKATSAARQWAHANCKDKFEVYGNDRWYFYSEQDSIMFTLRWS